MINNAISNTNKRQDKAFPSDPTPIDRVNKSISNNIRLTYKCQTLLETSWQGLPIYQHIGLILGGYLTLNT